MTHFLSFLQGSNALSLMLKKGHDRRREDELWKAFSEADKNNDGYLSVEEYVSVFRSHGIQISQEEVRKQKKIQFKLNQIRC